MGGEAVVHARFWCKQSLCFALHEVLYSHGVSTHQLPTAAVGRNSLRRKFAQEFPVTDEPNGALSVAITPTQSYTMTAIWLSFDYCLQYCRDLDETFGTKIKLCCDLVLSHHTLPVRIRKFLSAHVGVKFKF